MMHLPELLVVEAIVGSSIHKLTSINRYALLPGRRFARAMILDSVQPAFFALLLAIYIGSLWLRGSSIGWLETVSLIYLISFVASFPVGVAIARTLAEWRASIELYELVRKRRKNVGGIGRAIRRSILLALEWNSLIFWTSLLVLWFEAAGYQYETAVAGVLQRFLNMTRVGTAVSLQINLTYYYTTWMTSLYLRTLSRQAIQFGCAIGAFCVFVNLAFPLSPLWLTRLSIGRMMAEITSHPINIGAICSFDYVFFHLSSFALGLNRNLCG
jgi:hypothetical protein